MQEMHISPLRKRKATGELYTRRSPITQFIENSLQWPFDEIVHRASTRDRRHSKYVPSEVLVYHLRQTKSDNSDGRFIQLYNILRDRIEAACPRPNRRAGQEIHEDARLSEIRDATINHVTELMFTDRQDYDEQLDIYEVDHAGRLFLNRFARFYGIPVIDVGLAMQRRTRRGLRDRARHQRRSSSRGVAGCPRSKG